MESRSDTDAGVLLHGESARRTGVLRWLLLAALLVELNWMLNIYPHWRDANSSSRVYLTLAIVEQGSFQIDRCIEKYGDIFDKAQYRGHRYSDKAPGTSFWFVPLTWLLRGLGVVDMRGTFYALRLCCVTLPTIGFWWYTLSWYRAWCGREDQAIALVAAGALGTNFFIFSTQLFAHVPAAWLLFLSFLAVRRLWNVPQADRRFSPALLAGGLAGLAFLNDYVVMPAVAALGIAALLTPRISWRQAVGFGIGVTPSIAAWMIYNWICFDHPLRTGFYYHSAEFFGNAYRSGFLGIQPVDWTAPIGMLFSPARGMLFLSPFLVLAPIGWWRQVRQGAERTDGIVSAVVCACLFFFAMTTVDWRGGWGIGTRYLVPAVPFLLVGVAGALRGTSATDPAAIAFAGLALVGVLLCGLAAATVPLVPQDAVNPLYSLHWPLARNGYFGPQLSKWVGGSWLALVPYLAALGSALFLVLWSGPARSAASRALSIAASATVAAAVMTWQYHIPEEPDEQLASKLLLIDSLASLGYYDEAARDMLDLLDRQTAAGESPSQSGAAP